MQLTLLGADRILGPHLAQSLSHMGTRLVQDPANHQGSLAWGWHTLGAFLVWSVTQ